MRWLNNKNKRLVTFIFESRYFQKTFFHTFLSSSLDYNKTNNAELLQVTNKTVEMIISPILQVGLLVKLVSDSSEYSALYLCSRNSNFMTGHVKLQNFVSSDVGSFNNFEDIGKKGVQ